MTAKTSVYNPLRPSQAASHAGAGSAAGQEDIELTQMLSGFTAGINKTSAVVQEQVNDIKEQILGSGEIWDKIQTGMPPFVGEFTPEEKQQFTEVTEENKRIPCSFIQSTFNSFRSYFANTTIFVPSESHDSDGGVLSQIVQKLSGFGCKLFKPKLVCAFPQAECVRVATAGYRESQQKQKVDSKPKEGTGNKPDPRDALPANWGKPVVLLAEILDILGVSIGTELNRDKKFPGNVRVENHSEGYANIGWFNSFFSSAARFDAVLGEVASRLQGKDEIPSIILRHGTQNDSKETTKEYGIEGIQGMFDTLHAECLDIFLKNNMLNMSLDEEVHEVHEGLNQLHKKFVEIISGETAASGSSPTGQKSALVEEHEECVLLKEKPTSLDAVVEDVNDQTDATDNWVLLNPAFEEIRPTFEEAERLEAAAKRRAKQKAQTEFARGVAVECTGCFPLGGPDLEHNQPVRYFFGNSLTVNCLALRVAASVTKDLHNQREEVKREFLEEKFKTLEVFDFYRHYMSQLHNFDMEFDTVIRDPNEQPIADQTGFMGQWEAFKTGMRREVIEKLPADLKDKREKIMHDLNNNDAQIAASKVKGAKSRENLIKGGKTDALEKIHDDRKLDIEERCQHESQRDQLLKELDILAKQEDEIDRELSQIDGILGAAHKKMQIHYFQMKACLKEAEELMEQFKKETGVDIAPFFLEGKQPDFKTILALANVRPEQYGRIQKKLSEANGYRHQLLQVASLGGNFNISSFKIQMQYYGSNVEDFKKSMRRLTREISCEDYPSHGYQRPGNAPRFERYKDALGRVDEQAMGDRREKILKDCPDNCREQLEKDWIFPMLAKSDFMHGLGRSLFWGAVTLVSGAALIIGAVAEIITLIVIPRLTQIVYYKILGGMKRSVLYMNGWGPKEGGGIDTRWINAVNDWQAGLVELVTFIPFALGSLGAEVYNETQLYNKRVQQMVFPFLQFQPRFGSN